MKNQKTALFTSLVSLLLCMAMLVGTTFAWFTDSVTSKGNKIAAGDLKIELYQAVKGTDGSYYTDNKVNWKNITNESDPLFDYDNWEPGYTTFVVLKVVNAGTLALDWHAELTSENKIGDLAEVINVYVNAVSNTDSATTSPFIPKDRTEATTGTNVTSAGTLKDFLTGLNTTTYGRLEKGQEAYLTLVLQMDEDAENKYQKANLGGEFDICIVATQAPVESDSFGSDYDKDSEYCDHKEFNADGTCKECGAYVREKDTTGSTTTPDPDPEQPTDPTPSTPDENNDVVMTLSFANNSTTATGGVTPVVTGGEYKSEYEGRNDVILLDNDDDITVDITSLYDSIKDGFTVSYWVSNQQADNAVKAGWSFSIYNPDNFDSKTKDNVNVERKYIGLLHNDSSEGNGIWLERGNLADGKTGYESSYGWDIYGYTTGKRSDWTHIVCVFDSNSTAIYVNGKLTHTNSTKTNYNTTLTDLLKEDKLQLTINKSQWDDEYLNAYYSDFAIYGKALTADEVTALYNSQKTVTTND